MIESIINMLKSNHINSLDNTIKVYYFSIIFLGFSLILTFYF